MRTECIRRELTMEIVVGVFMMLVLFGLAYFTIVLSGSRWMEKRYDVEVVFDNVMDLREGDNVVVRGMPVGKVKSLHLESNGVHVVAQLEKDLPLHKGYRANVLATSVLGGRCLQIDQGPDTAPVLPAGAVLRGEPARDFMADAAEIIAALKKGIVDENLAKNLADASADLKAIADRLNGGEGTIGKLLSEDDTLYKDLAATVASAKTIAARLENGTSSLGKLLAENTTLYDNLDKSVSSLRTLTDRVESGKGFVGKLLSEDDTLYTNLTATAASVRTIAARLENGEGTLGHLLAADDTVYKDLADTIASFKEVAARIEHGEGLVGRLIKDDALYTQIEQLVGEVRATVDDYRETSPVVSFTSIIFGAF